MAILDNANGYMRRCRQWPYCDVTAPSSPGPSAERCGVWGRCADVRPAWDGQDTAREGRESSLYGVAWL
eukprot:1901278-Rhodomonas_salina.3